MSRGVRWSLYSFALLVTLIALAGCSHYLIADREPWRRDAEASCLSSGAVKESAQRVRIASIDGPGVCGISYPLKVSALGEATPMSYTDEAPTPPGSIPNGSMPQHWPMVQSNTLPPLPPSQGGQYGTPYGQPQPYGPAPQPYGQPYGAAPQPQYGQPQYGAAQAGVPMSLTPPGVAPPADDDDDGLPPEPASDPYYRPPYPAQGQSPSYGARPQPAPGTASPYGAAPLPPLGPPAAPVQTAYAGEVEVKPAATLACPIVSALDQWITAAVQPAATHWFRQPVVEIKQISSYSCRGMNGNPNAHISEHAFGNALDIAEFILADGHKISVQYGWHGSPEEQGFLHDVQAAACDEFTTVLAPGANVYHYNHIHVDLMRHAKGRHICEPTAMSGEAAYERARARYAAQHGEPRTTGSLGPRSGPLGYAGDDDTQPDAVPGDD
jgi:hypothetical protein